MPKFAYVPTSSPYLVSDLYGNRRCPAVHFQARTGPIADCRGFDEVGIAQIVPGRAAIAKTSRGLSPLILGRVRELLCRYRDCGRFSTTELRTMHALLYEGLTLRELARRERVSDVAIHARLVGRRGRGGLLKKAPAFARWWQFAGSWRRRERRS
jgi:hypothetical protein